MCIIIKIYLEKKVLKGEWGDGGSSMIVSSYVMFVFVFVEFFFMC